MHCQITHDVEQQSERLMMEVFRDKDLSDREKYMKLMSIYSQRRHVDGKTAVHITYLVRFTAVATATIFGAGAVLGAIITVFL